MIQCVYEHFCWIGIAIENPKAIANVYMRGRLLGTFGFLGLPRYAIETACLNRVIDLAGLTFMSTDLVETHVEIEWEGSIYTFRYNPEQFIFKYAT